MFFEIKGLTKKFGGLTAVDDLTMTLDEQSMVALIGPNGAGKTTLINTVSGIYTPDRGSISFKGERIDGMKPFEIVRRGIGRTFQVEKVFRRMTVLDNLVVPGLRVFRDHNELVDRANELLKLFLLDRLRDEFAVNLSGGQKKLLDVARALMPDPELVLLDEPFHGVHPRLKETIVENVLRLNKEKKKSFLVVSHDMPSLLSLSKRVIVLDAGTMIADGSPEQVREDKGVLEAYLGA